MQILNQAKSLFRKIHQFKPKRRFLVFSSIDTNRSAYTHWLESNKRNYDVVLYVYNGELNDCRADYVVNKKGFKFQNFFDFSCKYNVFHYDAVWIVDDDIQITTEQINKLFNIFDNYGLWLGQPSYDDETSSAWKISFVDNNYLLRFTNFVENGVVIISRDALKICLPTLQYIRSGWGADFVWPTLLNFPSKKIAIIDDVQCHHPKINSSLNEKIPRLIHVRDGELLMDRFETIYYTPRVLDGIKK